MRVIRSLAFAFALAIASLPVAAGADTSSKTDVLHIDWQHPIRALDPRQALGSTVDKEPAGTIPALYSKHNVQLMLSAGLGFLSYRLFTELSDQDWHWNPSGSFSAGDEGYWISSTATPQRYIADSFGYRLEHRGNANDQGNQEDYSRLDDGDPHTYWKSNPYLTHAFTGDPDSEHPQWLVVDFGGDVPLDAMRIAWVNPYATRYRVQWWQGDDAIGDPGNGRWHDFAGGVVGDGHGGTATLRLAATLRQVHFLRVQMSASSDTCDSHGSGDVRNCVGYAIGEIYAGSIDARGRFHDLIKHVACGVRRVAGPCKRMQTVTYVSSVDPWHTAASRVTNQEQPGLDLIARSGLTRGIGAFWPVAMLYSTPENAVAEIKYLEKRGYPILGIELGEEPDGQYVEPEDDATLYVQFARAIHAYDPTMKLGGPVFSGVNSDIQWWPDAHGDISWLHRFVDYLKSHGRLSDLSFMSFEHYPFDGCEHGDKLTADLVQEPTILKTVVDAWHADGIPAALPLYITEANFTAVNFSQTPMQIEGALWQDDYMASSLFDGIDGVVYYQYEPVPLSHNRGCGSEWGNLTMFVADTHAHIRAFGAQYYGVQMLTKYWLHTDTVDEVSLFPVSIEQCQDPMVTAYGATYRSPDGSMHLSILVINKDTVAHDLAFFEGPLRSEPFPQRSVTFSSAQYQWQSAGRESRPDPDLPPSESSDCLKANYPPRIITHLDFMRRCGLPARSITVYDMMPQS